MNTMPESLNSRILDNTHDTISKVIPYPDRGVKDAFVQRGSTGHRKG